MKKLIATTLAVTMTLSIAALPMENSGLFSGGKAITASAEDLVSGDFKYTILDDGTAKITKYTGDDSELTIPDNIDNYKVTNIGKESIYRCTNLTSIKIPDSIITIEHAAFYRCESITTIAIPENVVNLENNPFIGCSKLASINVNTNNKNFCSKDGVVYSKDMTTLICCPGGKSTINIPNGVKIIADYAFCGAPIRGKYGCTSAITDVTFPESVLSIGSQAFEYCYNLQTVKLSPNLYRIYDWAFQGCSNLKDINLENVQDIYEGSFYGCTKLEAVTFSNKLKSLYDCSFSGTGLKEVTIPESIEEIGGVFNKNNMGVIGAFNYCTSLTKVIIKDGVKTIGKNTFSNCSSLNDVTIPDSVTRIGDRAFDDTSIVNNQNTDVKYVCNWAVDCNSDCESIKIKTGSNICDFAFVHKSNLKYVILPENIKYIGMLAFSDCNNLKNISIPKSVIEIGNSAFGYYHGGKNSSCIKIDDFTIKCYKDTEGEKYAKNNGFTCEYLDQNSKDISECTIELSTNSFTYDGDEKRPSITVKNDSHILSDATDYAISYKNNVNAGTATIIITGKGNYTGIVEKSFTINAKSISNATVTLSQNSYTYDGNEKKPTVSVKDETKTLINDTDYTVSYSNNINLGTATVTITGKCNFTGKISKEFQITENKKFTWGRDNWSFDNSEKYFKWGYAVNDNIMSKMQYDFKLSNSDIFELKWRIANSTEFYGSCFGMTISEILATQNDLDLSKYGGNKIVNKNTNTSDMTSVINFIQLLQTNSNMCQAIRQSPFLEGSHTQESFISKINDVLTKNNCYVKLSYKIVTQNQNTGESSDGYHAVLAYGIENCNYYSNVTGKSYDKKILIADPNYLSNNNLNKDACLYYKSSDDSWIVPYWNKNYNNGKIRSCYWNSGSSTKYGAIRNIMKYNSLNEAIDLMSDYNAGHYIAGLNITNTSKNISNVEQVKNTGNPNADYAGSYSNGIARYDSEFSDDVYISDNDEMYALWNPTASYTLSYNKPSKYKLKMDYEDVDYYVDTENATYTLFKPSGAISMRGSNAKYKITMVSDESACVNDWYALTVSGSNVDNLTYKKENKGYVISASNLNNVSLKAISDNKNISTKFSTKYNSAYIYQFDKNSIGVSVDTDKNGTYETLIASTSSGTHSHNYTTKVVKPTCTAKGYTIHTCSSCGKFYKDNYKNAVGHKYVKVKVVKSTYFAKGYTAKKCSTCGAMSNKKETAILQMSAPKVSVTSNSIKLTWSKVSGAKGYDVYQYKNNKWTKIKTTTSTNYTVSKLPSGTSQKFVIKPYTKSGSKTVYGAFSKQLYTSTNPATVNFKLSAGSRKATVKWNKVTGATGYKVYYKTSKNGSWKSLKTVNNRTTSYTKTGLAKGKTYYFTVKAYRTTGGKTYNGGYATKRVKI